MENQDLDRRIREGYDAGRSVGDIAIGLFVSTQTVRVSLLRSNHPGGREYWEAPAPVKRIHVAFTRQPGGRFTGEDSEGVSNTYTAAEVLAWVRWQLDRSQILVLTADTTTDSDLAAVCPACGEKTCDCGPGRRP